MPLALLLDASKDHFGSRNVFLGVFQVLHQGVLAPDDTFALVGFSVGVALCLASLAAKQPPQVRSDFVLSPIFYSVALGALLYKRLFSFGNISHSELSVSSRSLLEAECVAAVGRCSDARKHGSDLADNKRSLRFNGTGV